MDAGHVETGQGRQILEQAAAILCLLPPVHHYMGQLLALAHDHRIAEGRHGQGIGVGQRAAEEDEGPAISLALLVPERDAGQVQALEQA